MFALMSMLSSENRCKCSLTLINMGEMSIMDYAYYKSLNQIERLAIDLIEYNIDYVKSEGFSYTAVSTVIFYLLQDKVISRYEYFKLCDYLLEIGGK